MVKEKLKPAATTSRSENPGKDFLMAALNMSWQLAIVVLIPIIGGFELDKKLDTLPALTMVGFLIAMAGTGVIMWQQLKLNEPPKPSKSKGRSS